LIKYTNEQKLTLNATRCWKLFINSNSYNQ